MSKYLTTGRLQTYQNNNVNSKFNQTFNELIEVIAMHLLTTMCDYRNYIYRK